MKIKTRLALYFTLISSGALLLVLLSLYLAVYSFSREDFYDRLTDRANVAAQLYLEADEIANDSLVEIQQRYLDRLSGEVIRIYNEQNRSAFNTHNDIFWTDSIINQVRQDKYIKYREGKQQVVGKAYHDNQGDFVILVSAIDKSFPLRALRMGQFAVVLFIVFSLGLFFAGRLFATKSLAPIKQVINQLGEIRSSSLHMRVADVKNKDEIAELISNFNNLLERLENAFELQKTFIANASHELRTPLTSIIGQVDVTLNKPRTTPEYEAVLKSINTDAARLQGTITSLMELAQADLSYTSASLAPVRIDELLWELHDTWTTKKGADMLKIRFVNMPDDEQQLEINGNKPLLYIAINNIIDNAYKYSGNQPVEVVFDANESHVKMAVTDMGVGLTQQEATQVFKPFYRTERANKPPGSGIGLYIADKIIRMCNGTIQVSSDGRNGSTFTIEFIRATA